MNVVIVGASSGVGKALAECAAARGDRTVLTARRGIGDLVSLDVTAFDPRAFLEECVRKLGSVDLLLVPCGAIDDADVGPGSVEVTRAIFQANALGPITLMAEFARYFERQGTGGIIAFSSIAAGAPRARNAAYAAAKCALESYCRSLRHHLASTKVRVGVVALGYVNTRMTAGKKLLFPVSEPEAVAKFVFRKIGCDFGKTYFPGWWFPIVLALKSLPWFLYKKLSF